MIKVKKINWGMVFELDFSLNWEELVLNFLCVCDKMIEFKGKF